MFRVALINMPFAAAELPSIALTQLKARVRGELGDAVHCEVLYPNLDFVRYVGPGLYEMISTSVQANTSGLGDWFFTPVAFPDHPDNPDAYLTRHFAEFRAQLETLKKHLVEKRRNVGAFLDTLIDEYDLTSYDLLGFTSMFSQNVASFAVAKKLKEQKPEIVIALGGANCEAPMGNVVLKNVPWVDFVFSGPALISFPQFVRHLAAGEEAACHRIPGVLSRQKAGTAGGLALVGAAPSREIGPELDISVDVPLDYDDYFAAFDERVPREANLKPKLPFETSRGCWWGERAHCTFCGLNGQTMKYRAMPPAQALSLLHGLFERYGSRVAEFQSVDNILPREYLTDVLPHLATPEGAAIFYEVKADLKEREMEVMAKARVRHIQPGIEALSTTTLKLMRKGTTSFQNLKFLKHCHRYDVVSFWNLLVGFPHEPEEVYKKYYDDLPLFTHLQPPSGVYPVRFDRFSPYHTQAKEYGLKLKPCDFYRMVYPFPEADFEDMAYFFVDQEANAQYRTVTAKWLGKLRERVIQWQTRWHQRDRRPKPELVFRLKAGSPVVHDTRTGAAVDHPLSPLAVDLLDLLTDLQHPVHRAAEKLGVSQAEVAAEIARLKQRGLVFEEDGFYLSLVLKPEGESFLPLRREAAVAQPVAVG